MPTPPDAWPQALAGDRDAFQAAVAPYHDRMMAAAARQIAAEEAAGTIRDRDLTPEELVGEALVQAWSRRDRFDAGRLSFRAWLLGLQTRALARFTQQERLYTQGKAVSLDEEVPANEDADAVGEALYEFRQPFDVTTYADLIPGSTPVDIGADGASDAGAVDTLGDTVLSAGESDRLADAGLDATGRTAVLLHDEFELSLAETAQILDASLKDTAATLELARVTLRETAGSAPTPDRPRDARDSYTGDPV